MLGQFADEMNCYYEENISWKLGLSPYEVRYLLQHMLPSTEEADFVEQLLAHARVVTEFDPDDMIGICNEVQTAFKNCEINLSKCLEAAKIPAEDQTHYLHLVEALCMVEDIDRGKADYLVLFLLN